MNIGDLSEEASKELAAKDNERKSAELMDGAAVTVNL